MINGIIMSENDEVTKIENNKVILIDINKMLLYLANNGDIEI